VPWLERPLIMLGHGIQASGSADLANMILGLGLPVAASWPAKDLVDNTHPSFLGCTGVYGNRAANLAFSKADQILALGNRLSLWNIAEQGLDHKPRVEMVDADPSEAERLGATHISQHLSLFMRNMEPASRPKWLAQCQAWKEELPWLEMPAHENGRWINSYQFTRRLEKYLRLDEVIVTDMGTPLICAHQVLRLKPPQRLMTSGGLGEMGCGLPAAIGASLAGAKHVLCLHADGGMMMNLQELQTIINYKLPIKIIVYENDGYLMIKHTQKNSGMIHTSVDAASGVGLPDFVKLAHSLGFAACHISTWEDFTSAIPQLFAAQDPALVVYHMDPEQPLVPRLKYILPDGSRPRFEQMSPLLTNT